ncbi:MAG TPA: GNAT family N-acetyltransferase [Acidimicrobiales bacterium]|nr:GNAT family N-acetyltransferase [Acidimicrobiales bacterium]
MAVLPLRTARLVLRLMHPGDAPAFAGYRNDPDVARHQDWTLPFTTGDAERLLAGQAYLDDLDPEGWTQVAVEHEGQVVGDVAVHLETSAQRAALGYTLAPRAQHRGFAVEAVGAMVDALFERTATHRIVATLDEANLASMRVVETVGFRFEGIARQAARVRGQWADDARFALLQDDRAAWLSRSRAAPEQIDLVELVYENVGPYERLATHRYQEQFVAPMATSFVDALLPEVVNGERVTPWFRGVTADGVPVGFVMLALASPAHPDPFLWRLLIDRWHQRRGIGGRVLGMLSGQLRAEGHRRLVTSWAEGLGGPAPFYGRLGFEPTGNLIDDEIEAALEL